MYTIVLNTGGADYDSIIATQTAAFAEVEGHTNYKPRLSLDGSMALARIFGEVPTGEIVLATQETPQDTIAYIQANSADWEIAD